jgi:hypothetical protein
MEYDLPRAGGLLLAIVAIAVGGLVFAPFMSTRTVLMMVLPSMIVFAGIAFALGVKHGEHRATR